MNEQRIYGVPKTFNRFNSIVLATIHSFFQNSHNKKKQIDWNRLIQIMYVFVFIVRIANKREIK